MLKLDAIRSFVVVARCGNLRDAGEVLGRTQSALSMTLAQLEATLGGPLFVSDRKRDLTDLGVYLRDLGEGLVREHDRVVSLIESYAKGHAGSLRIASVPSVAGLILPDMMRGFMQAHSGARIDLVDSDSADVRKLVAAGQADLGIAGPAAKGPDLVEDVLFHDRLHIVCPEASPLLDRPVPLKWRDLNGVPLIANETLSTLDDPQAHAVIAQSNLFVRNVSSLLAMVRSGMGVTVLPGLATRSLGPDLRAIPLEGSGAVRPISLLTKSSRAQSPLAAAFGRYVMQQRDGFVVQFDLDSRAVM